MNAEQLKVISELYESWEDTFDAEAAVIVGEMGEAIDDLLLEVQLLRSNTNYCTIKGEQFALYGAVDAIDAVCALERERDQLQVEVARLQEWETKYTKQAPRIMWERIYELEDTVTALERANAGEKPISGEELIKRLADDNTVE